MTATLSVNPTFKLVNPLEDPNWDVRLLSHPDYSVFHSSAWAQVMWQTYGYEPVYLCVIEGNRMLALLPVMEAASWLKGRRGVSLPFTDVCEFLDSRGLIESTLLPEAIKLGHKRGWKYLEVRGNREHFGNTPTSGQYIAHTLDLCPDPDKQFERCESGVRRAIRKSEREGVRVEIVRTMEGVEHFYRLHCLTRRKHGLPPQSFTFFRHIHQYIIDKSLGFVSLARWEDKVVAASVFLNIGTRALYKYGASDLQFQSLRANNLVMWEAIKWLGQHGYKTLHFGRSDVGHDGLRRFKCGWGATEQPLEYFRYSFQTNNFAAMDTPPEQLSLGLANRVFQKLPVGVGRLIGKLAYRHMA
ncbi:MAG: hypothetical protein JWO95_1396 [Verrucomicrobiales bacterium]|nr:hypothetical protein [Verrucomicrobiales bacterium]